MLPLAFFTARARRRDGRARLLRDAARWLARTLASPPRALRPLYRLVAPKARRRIASATFERFGWPDGDPGGEVHQVPDASPGCEGGLDEGLALVGYPFAEIGVGEAMRALARSAVAADIPLDLYNFDVHVRARQDDHSLLTAVTNRLTRAVNVFCVNADLAADTLRMLGPSVQRGRVNVIRPFWELSLLLPDWRDVLSRFDEIWAPTTFVKDAFALALDTPVIHIPVAVAIESPGPDRARFGIPDDAFVFLQIFDLASYPARKNPEGVIRAFRMAFGSRRASGDPLLVVKLMGNGAHANEARAFLTREARSHPGILLMDQVLDRRDVASLIDSVDAVVSLHRSEGFGFTVAEAMALGKPVIATDYSGTRDFVSEATGFPVGYELVAVRPYEYPHYVDGQVWAEPDLVHAAAQMRRVVDERGHAAAVAERGQAFIREHHAPAVVGARLRAHLEQRGYYAANGG